MIADLAVRRDTIVLTGGCAAPAISGGTTAAVDRGDALPAVRETTDAAGLHPLPSVIDTRVRPREPGRLDREDCVNGT